MEFVDFMGLVAEECSRYPDCEFDGDAVLINGNIRMLQHLVRNLVDNAYTHGKAPVKVHLSKKEHHVQLRVTDGGNGIPDSEWERVFEPFYRAKGKQNVQGFGLGLPIIKKIAESHGATIMIENKPNSAITVTFPASQKGIL